MSDHLFFLSALCPPHRSLAGRPRGSDGIAIMAKTSRCHNLYDLNDLNDLNDLYDLNDLNYTGAQERPRAPSRWIGFGRQISAAIWAQGGPRLKRSKATPVRCHVRSGVPPRPAAFFNLLEV